MINDGKTLCWEDFRVGRSWSEGPRTIQQEEIIAFAREYDPQDFHVDPELALRSPLGALCASGVHTFGIAQRMSCEAFLLQTHVVAGGSIDRFRMRIPVLAEDTLHLHAEVQDTTSHSRKKDRGWVTFLIQVLREDDELVLEYQMTVLIMRRGPYTVDAAVVL